MSDRNPDGRVIRPLCDVEVDGDVAEEVDEEEEEEEDGGEERKVHKMNSPRKPSTAEVDHHNLTHLPYRNWCRHCIRGKGKEAPHPAAQDGERTVPELHLDYCFPGEEEPGKNLTVLVARMKDNRMTMSTVIPSRTTGEFTGKRIMAFLRECGCELSKLIVKSDQEPAILALIDDMIKQRVDKGADETIPENSPTYSHQSNGVAERAVQSVEGMIRTMRSALEERITGKLEIEDSIWPWVVEYASYLLNRMEVGKDGKTAYERSKGKAARVHGIEFGEAVLWKRRPVGGALGKLAVLWEDGVFLGVKGTTGEIIIGAGEGIYRTRTVQRKPVEDRWREDLIKKVKGVPWRKSDNDPETDGAEMRSRPLSEEEQRVIDNRNQEQKDLQGAPKRFAITVSDLQKHGVTEGCNGCKSAFTGKVRQPHTRECRARFEKLLESDEKVKASVKRENEFYAKVTEADGKRRKRAEEAKAASSEDSPGKKAEDQQPPKPMTRNEVREDVQKMRQAAKPMTRNEVRDDVQKMKRERTLRSRRLSPEERLRILRLRSSAAAAETEEERAEREAAAAPANNPDELEHAQGDTKKARINSLEGTQPLRDRIIAYLANHSDLKVNDDLKEAEWDELLTPMMEGDFIDEEAEQIFDELTGKGLDVEEVRKARQEEIEFVKQLKVYEEVPIGECWANTGKAPIGTRWVDILKGNLTRSRLVAQDFKKKGEGPREDLFAAMPPLEAKKALFRMAAAKLKGNFTRDGKKMKLMFIDVRKAHLNAACDKEHMYVSLPEEAGAPPGTCGRLLRWLYGMRGAAQGWETEFGDKLVGIGFTKGRSTPVVFHRESDDTSLVVHGDDFTFLGYPGSLQEILAQMKSWWDIKLRAIVGDERGDDQEVTILNRTLKWTGEALTLSADPKHVQEILKAFNLTQESRGISIPVDPDAISPEDEEEMLVGKEITNFRGLAARANYLGQDRCDVQYAAKEVSRGMAKPSKGSMLRMKRLARYLLEVPEGILTYHSDEAGLDKIEVFVDSDWAGCKVTRKSTSGGAIAWGGGLLKSWSTTQGSIALSSGEAEFYAAVKGCKEGIGVKALLADLGVAVQVEVMQDSTSAKGTASRIGIGKIKHLDTGWLWIQDVVRAGVVTLKKICGKINPADLLTKPKSAAEAGRLASALGYRLVVRKKAGAESFTGQVWRMMRGDRRPKEEQWETVVWWIEKEAGGSSTGN
jgi:hypothetical protein